MTWITFASGRKWHPEWNYRLNLNLNRKAGGNQCLLIISEVLIVTCQSSNKDQF